MNPMKGVAKPRPVVVGIDGSREAIAAALWAVEEAVGRHVPLRLLHATEPGDTQAAAEMAIRHAVKEILATGKPVSIETEVVRGPAIGSLIRASASAGMVCVGAVGRHHFRAGRVGTIAAGLAMSARCPVAVLRAGHDHRPEGIVIEVDGSPDNGAVLDAAVTEARLRNAPITAIVRRQPGDRRALADLDRRLAPWTRRHPGLRIESAAIPGGLPQYLACRPRPEGLVIAGARNRRRLGELVGPAGCSLLVVDRQHL